MGEEGKVGVVGRHQDEGRAGRVRRYGRFSAAVGRLWEVRSELVRRYLLTRGLFPSGADGRVWGCEAWYVPGEWALVDGKAVRSVTESVTESVTVTGVTEKSESVTEVSVTRSADEDGDRRLTASEKQKRYRDRLRAARAVLARIREKER